MCTLEKRGKVFHLILTGPDEQHRLNPTTIDSIRSALAQIRSDSTPGSALVTSSDGRFFSNGFDLAWASSPSAGGSDPAVARRRLGHMVSLFSPLVADLLSLPMPTIAAVTGHAAAAGRPRRLPRLRADEEGQGVPLHERDRFGASLTGVFHGPFEVKDRESDVAEGGDDEGGEGFGGSRGGDGDRRLRARRRGGDDRGCAAPRGGALYKGLGRTRARLDEGAVASRGVRGRWIGFGWWWEGRAGGDRSCTVVICLICGPSSY
ncbi:hypothetical protein QJS04_geneDACA000877 [Acorus gramineus]|uniref:Uncharacterized protein n=1 Tax=Acorus gramineus TaxID=55184 RepID=A0AAV9BH57_ACOGR|nr:hypothetical protein QJS04_geneDACA000877 [Acorus gramineus]